jgi:HEPN domain-containing protein
MKEASKLVREWIDKADHDLGSAKLIYLHIPDYFDMIAFHCQQATEKYIKAILEFNEIEFQRTHNIVFLLELLSKHIEISEEQFDKAIMLNGFSVQIRYPDSTIFLTNEELETSIMISQEFRDLAIKQIGIEEI